MTSLKLAALAVVVVSAFSALVVQSAFALPEFKSTGNVTYTGVNLNKPVLTFQQLGIVAKVECEKFTVSGKIINASMEATKNVLTFSGKCEQTIGTSKSTCTEPIVTVELKGTLGYIGEESKGPVGLLLKPESDTAFAAPNCGGSVVTLKGELVGEFAASSINKVTTKFTLNYAASGVKQTVTSLFLLPVSPMTGVHLVVSGFFGGEASLAVNEELTTSMAGEIKA